MEGVNSFEKGLHRSNSPQQQPEGSYVDALNWIRNDSGRLVNEELEEITQSLTDGAYEILGYCSVQDSFICFFKKDNIYSEVGIFDNVTKQYRRVFNDFFTNYRLNFTKEIDSVARINSYGETVVYFVEENNPVRRFNITQFENLGNSQYSSELYNTSEDWNLQLNFKMPYGEYSLIGQGSLPSGTYSFAYRYVTDQNNKTTFSIPSRFINIPGEVYVDSVTNTPIYNDKTLGGNPQTNSGLSLRIKLKNVDDNYPFIEVIAITYLGITNSLSIRSLGVYENILDKEIIFSDDSQYVGDQISQKDLLEMPVFINSAKSIEQKDNILVLSNITSKKYDEGFQEVANQIELNWSIDKVPVDNRRHFSGVYYRAFNGNGTNFPTINFPTGEGSTQVPGRIPGFPDTSENYYNLPLSAISNVFEQNFQQSNVYADPFILKGFTRGEVYSFSITPIYKDGSVGFSYHIPGKLADPNKPNRLVAWPSINTYSSSYNSSGLTGYIRHHQMPDYDVAGYVGDAHNINVLRVTATNINFTSAQLNNIQGYIIGYQPRVDDLTRRVVDTGFVKPYVYRSDGTLFKYQGGTLDGTVEYNSGFLGPTGGGGNWSPAWNVKYTMYYSADTLLNKASFLKNNYNIQQLGIIGNYIVMRDPQFGLNASAFFNNKQARLSTHNASFSDASIYSPEYILSRFPYLISKSPSTEQDMVLYLFMELNNWQLSQNPKTTINYFSHIDDVNGAATVGIKNFPSSILRTTSAYTHLETDQPYISDLKKLMIVAAVSVNDSRNRFYYLSSRWTGNVTGDDARNYGDPRFRFVRITNDISAQYGKLENGTYTPCAVEFDDNAGLSNNIILEGDTYISKIFTQMVNCNAGFEDPNGSATNFLTHSIVGYYAESKNNYSLRHQDINVPTFFPYEKEIRNTNGTGGIMNAPWDLDTISYNKQYSSLTSPRVTFPKPLFFNEASNYTNRSVYSRQSFESELIDQYRIFPSINYHDVPKHRGAITDTFVFNNNFYHHTEYGLWLSYFNPNTTQATSQGEVVLGNAGVFQLPSKLVLDIKGGYMGTLDKSGTNTPFGRVFLDHKQGKIFLLTGEAPAEISDLGLFSYFRDFINTSDKYCMGYDWANKRLLINNINKERAISYYPKTQTWTSFHTFSPKAYFTTNGYSYAYNETFFRGGVVSTFYNLNNLTDVRKGSYITFVENTSPDAFKRFDRIEMNTMSGGRNTTGSPGFVEPGDYVFLDKSFSTIHCWTDRQNTTELPFAYSNDFEDNFLSNYKVDEVPVNYYKSSFHSELPLDAVIDPHQNIFDLSNTDINADFRAHMKGKFLYTKLSYNDDKPLVLNYIKTFFKPSVA